MKKHLCVLFVTLTLGLVYVIQPCAAAEKKLPLKTIQGTTTYEGVLIAVDYRGRKAVQLTAEKPDNGAMTVLDGVDFKDGVIEADVAGDVTKDADLDKSRGFIGIAFRVAPKAEQFELMYLRTLNGRAPDQLHRNHSVQYMAEPNYSWKKLREESPGVYESYVDLEPGVWTHMKIVIHGLDASLYVNNAPQPCLVVHDLKLGADAHGSIGLWIGDHAIAHYSNLVIKPE